MATNAKIHRLRTSRVSFHRKMARSSPFYCVQNTDRYAHQRQPRPLLKNYSKQTTYNLRPTEKQHTINRAMSGVRSHTRKYLCRHYDRIDFRQLRALAVYVTTQSSGTTWAVRITLQRYRRKAPFVTHSSCSGNWRQKNLVYRFLANSLFFMTASDGHRQGIIAYRKHFSALYLLVVRTIKRRFQLTTRIR